jgi:hypothetical protein
MANGSLLRSVEPSAGRLNLHPPHCLGNIVRLGVENLRGLGVQSCCSRQIQIVEPFETEIVAAHTQFAKAPGVRVGHGCASLRDREVDADVVLLQRYADDGPLGLFARRGVLEGLAIPNHFEAHPRFASGRALVEVGL